MDESNNTNKDQDITNTRFAKDVLTLAGLPDGSPYLFMVGVGSAYDTVGATRYGYTVTEQDKYTVYYAVYQGVGNTIRSKGFWDWLKAMK